jgi:hypothetical protein
LTGLFYIAVPQNGPSDTGGNGAVVVVDPRGDATAIQVVNIFPTVGCAPNGLALGPNYEAFLGCSSGAGSPGAQIIDIRTGRQIAKFPTLAGCDEVYYNPGDNHFLGACGGVGIVDADPPSLDQKIVGISHSIAADPVTNQVIAPVAPNGALCGGTTNPGCIAIFGYPLTQVNVAAVPATTNQQTITLDASGSTSATGSLSFLFTVEPGGNTPTITQSPTGSKATVMFNGGPGIYLLQVIVVDGAGNTSSSQVFSVMYTGQ